MLRRALTLLLLGTGTARADVTLPCDRPADPAFEAVVDAADPRRNAARLREYSTATRIYIRCLLKEMNWERDSVLASAERFREQLRWK